MSVKNPSLSVVLVSGGMDSCVTAAIAARDHKTAFLHVNYGQRTEQRELQAFQALADHFQVEHRLVVSFGHLGEIGGSSLTDHSIDVSCADLKNLEIPSSYVPFRNANILAMATSWAEVIGASAIFLGAMEEDSSGYPDCRRSFFDAFEEVIDLGTRPETRIRIMTPLIALSKADVVQKGTELGAPFHLTWSCYVREDVACGQCDSCALRLRGFQKAEVPDPLPYAVRPNYL
ncbi:MAG TPA: 7-cyano-7-deazaguanine synthase QueC [bacterium]|nr:7-cyano-7-deazaguanine synthase QueC [bacterium]